MSTRSLLTKMMIYSSCDVLVLNNPEALNHIICDALMKDEIFHDLRRL